MATAAACYLDLHLKCLVCKRYKKVTVFVFTRSHQALRFHLAPFRNRAQIVAAKVTFSNNFASPCVNATAIIVTFLRHFQTAPVYCERNLRGRFFGLFL